MECVQFSWPDGKAGAVTTSWDDGTEFDRRLVEIFGRYGLKGTFNLNSGKFGLDARSSGWKAYLDAEEVATLFADHEVAVHTVTHPWLDRLPDEAIMAEVMEDRRRLEALVRYPVRGMALPFGAYDDRVNAVLARCGILYSRTCGNEPQFKPPVDFLTWHASCHHKGWPEAWPRFLESKRPDRLFYLWGHSYEFDNDDNWALIEDFCAAVAERDDCWLATNMQVHDYLQAWRGLRSSLDGACLENPSGQTIWCRHADAVHAIPPGGRLVVA